jgi:hypothetical protein
LLYNWDLDNLWRSCIARQPYVFDAWIEYAKDVDDGKGKRGIEKKKLREKAIKALENRRQQIYGYSKAKIMVASDNKI